MIDDKLRAKLAQDALNNPAVLEALDVLEKEVVYLWEACPIRDKEGQEELCRFYKTSKRFRKILFEYVESGKLPRLTPEQGLMAKLKNTFAA